MTVLSALLPAAVTGTSAGCVGPHGRVDSLCTGYGSIHIPVNYLSILPLLIMGGGALLLLLVSALLTKRSRPGLYSFLTLVVGAASALTCIWQWLDIDHHGARLTIGGQVAYDHFSVLFILLISVATILGALFSDSYLQRERLDGVEGYVLMLMAGAGAMLMAQSAGLIMLFLGLEVMSIALYVMTAFHRRREASGEGGLKYFLLGSFSSAIFLYGVALLYGATGSLQFSEVGRFLATNTISSDGVLLAGMFLIIVGLGFKVSAVPFHYWSPDVYQGSPTPFTGYQAAVAKAAGFAGLLRVLDGALISQQVNWRPAIWLIAILTLLVGSILAIVQKDIKRMLAYSSISQAGYVLIGLQSATSRGVSAALFYLFTYTFIIAGSFAVVSVVQGRGELRNDLGAFRGLGRRRPVLAFVFLIFLLAQAGIPLTSGFLAKFYVIEAAVSAHQYSLAVIGMLAAAIAAFFYLRVALLMYADRAPVESAETVAATTPLTPAAAAGAPAAPYRPGAPSGPAADLPAAQTRPGPVWAALAEEPQVDRTLVSGLAPVPTLDEVPAGTAAVLEAPPAVVERVPPAAAIGLAVCVIFTIFAGVSSPVIDFARQAHMIF